MKPVNIDDIKIHKILESSNDPDPNRIKEILHKALNLESLTLEDIVALTKINEPELQNRMFETARKIKEKVFGKRLLLFVPLYISNYCCNDCAYCAFRSSNRELIRLNLSQDEIKKETEVLLSKGHTCVLLVTGEAYPAGEGISYITKAVETIRTAKIENNAIRRVNINIAPLSIDDYRKLKSADIGTYHLYQETYHQKTYSDVHPRGKKSDYEYRISAIDRAIEGGLTDVGLGVLLGLYDWRFEILALMQHIRHIESNYGIHPHTISIPRVGPALGSSLASNPPFKVSNEEFTKLVAILRLALPCTEIILSTRETPRIRRDTYALGVSQISAGSRTSPGGYSSSFFSGVSSQFQLGDLRSLEEVVLDAAVLGYIPSLCGACGSACRSNDVLKQAKEGKLRDICDQNALITFFEYILDYASEDTRAICEKLIDKHLESMDSEQKDMTKDLLDKIRSGERNLDFV